MEDITKLELGALVDMLAVQTAEYTRMLREGTTIEEYENCKDLIDRLSAEIEARKLKIRSAGKPGVSKKNL